MARPHSARHRRTGYRSPLGDVLETMRLEEPSALAALIKREALVYGSFTLSSGRQAAYYVDLARLSLRREVFHALGFHVVRAMRGNPVWATAVGGPALGACPLVCAALSYGTASRTTRHGFFVRDGKKTHGVGEILVGTPPKGSRVLLVDDVVSTGETLQLAAQTCIQYGLIVAGAWCVVDRDKGAGSLFAKHGIPFASLFTMPELGIDVG